MDLICCLLPRPRLIWPAIQGAGSVPAAVTLALAVPAGPAARPRRGWTGPRRYGAGGDACTVTANLMPQASGCSVTLNRSGPV